MHRKLLHFIKSPNHQQWIIVGLVFVVYLIIGLAIYRNYGLSWDELYQRKLGILTGEYILGRNQQLLDVENRYHGQIFNLFQVVVEQAVGAREFPELLYVDHLVNFLFFYCGVVVFFFLARRIFRDWKAGLAAAMIMVLSPVIFSHSFYNSKDIPFLTAFIFSMYTLVRLEDHPNVSGTILHGILSGGVIALRVLGAVVPIFTLIVVLLGQFAAPKAERLSWRKTTGLSLIYLITLAFFSVLFFPISWQDPFGQYLEAFLHFRYFSDWNDRMLFMGQFITVGQIPWSYLPVWIGITTPFPYLLMFASGLVFTAQKLVQKPNAGLDLEKRNMLLSLLWLFFPLVVIIAGNSVVYDTWRHVFFVYPALVLISVQGLLGWMRVLTGWLSRKTAVIAVGAVLGLTFGAVVYHIVETHPLEHLFFNFMAGQDMAVVKENFELDYWGLSYRMMLERIAANDPKDLIFVKANDRAGEFSELIISKPARKRIKFVNYFAPADYFVTNFRHHPQDYDFPDEVYSQKIYGTKIATIFRLKGGGDAFR